MDYKEKYNDALERARVLIEKLEDAHIKGFIYHIFPELKESNDERIRKTLFDYFQAYKEQKECGITTFYGISTDNILAWLEKQTNTSDKEYVFRPLAGDTIEKAAERAVELDGKVVLAFNGAYIPVGSKTKDEIISEYCNWLEKQGEHIENFDEAEKEKADFVGDGFIECHADFLDFKEGETYWLEYIGDDNYNVRSDNLLGKTYHITPCQLYTVFKKLTWLEKHSEHAEVEPKFHEGDWIVLPLGIIAHIDSLNSTDYQVTTTDGKVCDFKISKQDNYHLWSIQDAKDGDVLSEEIDDEVSIFLFNQIQDKWIVAHGYYSETNSEFIEKAHFHRHHENLFSPATKEQHDLLFQKMADAGYEFVNGHMTRF